MINCYKKGQHNEKEVEDILLANGYLQTYKAPHVRFSKVTDIYGAWDIIGIRGDLKRIYIQVKSNPSDYSTAKKKLVDWVKMFGILTEEYYIILYENRKNIRKFDCTLGKEVPLNLTVD